MVLAQNRRYGLAMSDSAENPPELPHTEASEEPFDAPVRDMAPDEDVLVVSLDGYEGPMDLLLELSRKQKVDLRKISIVELVNQYLKHIEALKNRKIEIAADYLVMASWLTFLKTRLLLPAQSEDGEEMSADEMAAHLAFQLQRLEAMRKAADDIMDLPQSNIHYFPRGNPEGVRVIRKTEWSAELYDLLAAYSSGRVRNIDATIQYEPPKVYQIEEARARLARILGDIPDWSDLRSLLPEGEIDAPTQSLIASAFNAALEFAKAGECEIRQTSAFQPLYIRGGSRQSLAGHGETAPDHSETIN